MNGVEKSIAYAAGYGKVNAAVYEKAAGEPEEMAGKTEKVLEEAKRAAGSGGRHREDSIELSADRNQAVSESMIHDLFDILSKDYPGITILAESQEKTYDVRQMAVQLGRGAYVVVSREFLARMGRSQEDYEACKSVLKEALRHLSKQGKETAGVGVYLSGSKAVSWYVPDYAKTDVLKKMAEALGGKNGGTQNGAAGTGMGQSENAYRKPVVVSYSTMNHFSGMARAGSKGEVRKVMGDVHRSINNLRLAAVYGEEKERVKARRAMRSLQKLLTRGSRKIRKLDQEEILGVRKKRAEKARKEKRVREIKLEMKKLRSARKGADYGLIQEGISDTYMILGNKRGRYGYEPDRLAGSFAPYAGGTADPGAGMTGESEFSAEDVVVSASFF